MQLGAIATRGSIAVGLAGLGLPFISGAGTPVGLAVGLGGVLLAAQALAKLSAGAQSLVGFLIAWQQVGPLFNAASRPRELQPLDFVSLQSAVAPPQQIPPAQLGAEGNGQPLLLARDVTFRYRPLGRPAVQENTLQISAGDRVLLEGPSGGGKSTLAAQQWPHTEINLDAAFVTPGRVSMGEGLMEGDEEEAATEASVTDSALDDVEETAETQGSEEDGETPTPTRLH